MSEQAAILLLSSSSCAHLQEALSPHYQLLSAATYQQAELCLTETTVQAILLDIALYEENGCLPAAAAELPVLVFGSLPADAAETLLAQGVDDLLPEPVPAPLLLHRLRNAIALRAPAPSAPAHDLLSGRLGIAQDFLNDETLTLQGDCSALSALSGYSPQEIRCLFHDHLLELVVPSDRQEVLSRIRTQLAHGNSIALELQLLHKDGKTAWALVKAYLTETGASSCFRGIMLDISRNQQIQDGLRLSLERHQIIMSQTNDIVFELDLVADTLLCSPKWEERFGYPPITHQAVAHIAQSAHIHPEDGPKLIEAITQLRQGEHYLELEIRISNAAGQYSWNRLRATAQQDQQGQTFKLVGVIIDIEQEKRASQALLDKADRDSLTKLYNKNASRRHVEAYLSSRPATEQAALLIIDLDNFKKVNDQYGHMYGDAVLIQAAAEISSFFRDKDIVSRIGGDEFMVFMKNIPGRALVEQRCQQLIRAIHLLYHEQLAECNLSCSIGAALIPAHGTSFQELFQRADRALYSAKTQQKGCFVFYDLENQTSFPVYVTPKATSAEQISLKEDSPLIRYVFNRLYESGDVEGTIQSILELAGRQVNADRVYIFENSSDGRFCSNTFEWCSEGISPQLENLQAISYEEDVDHYHENFNEHGIFYCPDVTMLSTSLRNILEKQEIKSLLQCAVRDNGVFCGFVGFDQCTDHRLWTQDQINLLTTLSQILSLFLLKKRAQDRTQTLARDLCSLLDHHEDAIYVVDRETYQLLFLNAQAQTAAPQIRPGALCYEILTRRTSPCEDCPVTATDTAHSRQAKVFPIHWSGRDAWLIIRPEPPASLPHLIQTKKDTV